MHCPSFFGVSQQINICRRNFTLWPPVKTTFVLFFILLMPGPWETFRDMPQWLTDVKSEAKIKHWVTIGITNYHQLGSSWYIIFNPDHQIGRPDLLRLFRINLDHQHYCCITSVLHSHHIWPKKILTAFAPIWINGNRSRRPSLWSGLITINQDGLLGNPDCAQCPVPLD